MNPVVDQARQAAAAQAVELGAILRRRAGGAKASFALGVAFYLAGYVAFLYFSVAPLHLHEALTGLVGFGAGVYYVLWGLLWSLLWALLIHLGGLVDDLARWVGGVFDLAVDQVSAQSPGGVIVDLPAVERKVDEIVAEQAARYGGDSPWVPMVRQVAPGVAKQGLRMVVVRVAGDVWRDDKLTVEALRARAARAAGAEAAATLRKLLLGGLAVLLVLAAIVMGAPFAIVALLRWAVNAFG